MAEGHYGSARWSDFVRGVIETAEAEAMQRHLDRGCARCAGRLAALRAVAQVARLDRATDLPERAVRAAKRLFAVMQPDAAGVREVLMKLVFDSALEPLPAGVRRQGGPDRQLVFESEEYTLHLRLEPQPDTGQARLFGEIQTRDGEPMARVPAFLVRGSAAAAVGLSRSDGTFDLTAALDRGAELHLLPGDDRRIAVELGPEPDA